MRRSTALWFCVVATFSRWQGGAALTVDHPSGLYESAFTLTLAPSEHGARMFYTTNGTLPDATNGILYERPLRIATTTILRAAVFDGTTLQSDVTSRTYLFPRDVLTQTGAGFPPTWGNDNGLPIRAWYGMTETAGKDGQRRGREALAAIPSLSIITAPENLFSPRMGIYTHPSERGRTWECAASAELLDPQGRLGFQVSCGLRIHGGMSRHTEESPKHSFRLLFRRRYGAPRLQAPIFGANGPQEFDDLILRAGSNDSWLASDGQTRRGADYLRDEWTRRSLLAMGYPSARGIFVHLYLDGVYWGLYNLCERPEATWFASTERQPATEYDVRKGDKIESGDDAAWNQVVALANAGLGGNRAYQEFSRRVDVIELADFLILNFYAGNTDWDRSANWCAFRPRTAEGRFRFLTWDSECVLRSPEANTLDFDDDQSPPRLFQRLSQNAGFRALFAERARRLLFNDGPLAPGPAAARYAALAKSIERAIPAEASRWGSYRRDVHPYKTGPYELYARETHWQPEVGRLQTHYFPRRSAFLANQFRERGLFAEDQNAGKHQPARTPSGQ